LRFFLLYGSLKSKAFNREVREGHAKIAKKILGGMSSGLGI
jgi:hypothetical protein